jgi:hypothetical protein
MAIEIIPYKHWLEKCDEITVEELEPQLWRLVTYEPDGYYKIDCGSIDCRDPKGKRFYVLPIHHPSIRIALNINQLQLLQKLMHEGDPERFISAQDIHLPEDACISFDIEDHSDNRYLDVQNKYGDWTFCELDDFVMNTAIEKLRNL